MRLGTHKLPARGNWFRPSFFTGVSQTNRVVQEEIFGPVLSILTFRTPRPRPLSPFGDFCFMINNLMPDRFVLY